MGSCGPQKCKKNISITREEVDQWLALRSMTLFRATSYCQNDLNRLPFYLLSFTQLKQLYITLHTLALVIDRESII